MAMKEFILRFDEEFILPVAEWLALYNISTAAEMLEVDRQRVYQLIDEDTLEGIRCLDDKRKLIKVLVTKRSVNQYIEYRKTKSAIKRPSFA